MMQIFDSTIKDILNERLDALEKHFDADIVFFFGEIFVAVEKFFRDCIEKLKKIQVRRNKGWYCFSTLPAAVPKL